MDETDISFFQVALFHCFLAFFLNMPSSFAVGKQAILCTVCLLGEKSSGTLSTAGGATFNLPQWSNIQIVP